MFRQAVLDVERIAGPYRAKHIFMEVTDFDGCGQGVPQGVSNGNGYFGDRPGLIRLTPRCLDKRVFAHEVTHVFVGLGPAWFVEGAADVVAFIATGFEGNYTRRATNGKVHLDARPRTDAPEYPNQGGLGAQLLMEVNRLIGPEAMSKAIRHIAANPKNRSGQHILDTIAQHTPNAKKAQLDALFKQRIDYTK